MKKMHGLLLLLSGSTLLGNQAVEQPDEWRSRVFNHIYTVNHWKSDESFSGPGSTVLVTHEIRSLLPAIMRALNIESLLDAGCGDFNWMKEVDLGIDFYVGADIVEPLIDSNQKKYGTDYRCFLCLDVTHDVLPMVDAIMCRDCLAHMSHKDILAALKNFKNSGARYLIASHFPRGTTNKLDIRTGDFRPVNLQAAPFNLPEPIMSFVELSAEPAMKKAGKRLCVWLLSDIVIE